MTALTQRELAQFEAEVWAQADDKTAGEDPSEYIARKTGCSQHAAEHRRALLMMGPLADPLWARVESGMAPSVAVRLLRERVVMGDRRYLAQITPGEVASCLAAYDADPRSLRRRRRVKARGPSWKELREAVRRHARAELGEVGGQDAERIAAEFEAELGSLCADFRSRVARARKAYAGASFAGVSRRALEGACRELGLSPPARGMMVDMKDARTAKRALVKRYHPDVTRDERSRPMFDAVLAAYVVIEDYNEQVGGPHVPGREEGARDVG